MKTNVPIIILMRHLPTVDDANDILTPYNSEPKLLPVDNNRIKKIATILDSISEIVEREVLFHTDSSFRSLDLANSLKADMHHLSDIRIDDRWRNIQQGSLAGKTQREFSKIPLWRKWHERPTTMTFPGGESLFQVRDRVNQAISDFSRESNVDVIISHTTPLQVAITSILGLEESYIWKFYFSYYSFTIIVNDVLVCNNAQQPDIFSVKRILDNYDKR